MTTPVSSDAKSNSESSSTVDIQKLFDYKRVPQPIDWIPLVLYFPLGLCLFIIRLFIGLHAFLIASLLPKSSSLRCFILRSFCLVLGILVREQDTSTRSKSTRVIISNHITNIDHMAIDLVSPCVVPSVWDLPKFLSWCLGFCDFGIYQGREVLIQNVKRHLANDNCIPILAHPEGATTNGRVGMLKFSSWSFSLDAPVQPILLTLSRPPPISVAASLLGSRWWTDLFWFLFVPFTVFTVRYLPVQKRNENETSEEFAKRTQTVMANAGQLVTTNFSDSDKIEFAKRLFHVPTPPTPSQTASLPSPTSSSESSTSTRTTRPKITSGQTSFSPRRSLRVSPQLEVMAKTVQEVLPQVPLNVIEKDLSVTANVDETITRILEGTVRYVPLQHAESKSQPPTSISQVSGSASNNKTSDLPVLNTGAKTFGKNASERTKSFEERKAELLKNARLRYFKKQQQETVESQ